VERLFGCLKAKFKILTAPGELKIKRQVQLVYALSTLWNYLRQHKQLDDNEMLYANNVGRGMTQEDPDPPAHVRSFQDDVAMCSKRVRLADKLWTQYQCYLQ
jgi:hypothetical protein